MGPAGLRPGSGWRQSRSLRRMQGHQLPAEPVRQLGGPVLLGRQERGVWEGARDATSVSPDGGTLPRTRLELVRPRGQLPA